MNKTVVVGFISFAVGFAFFPLLIRFNPYEKSKLVPHHWRLVDDYLKFMSDPTNYRNQHGDLIGATVPYEIEPSLVYLASVGELRSVDLVLPKVPYKSKYTKLWQRFLSEHSDKI